MFFFFFQAEDGIRDYKVTGVQTCALPISVEAMASGGKLHPLQETFADLGAAQCGYCTPAFLLTAEALLAENPKPSRDEIKVALSGNLCRCTGYIKIYEAVELAAAKMRGEQAVASDESLYGRR